MSNNPGVFPAVESNERAEELRALGRDDGGRLVELLWFFRREREREPRNLMSRTYLQRALARAGLVREAHDEAREVAKLMAGLPSVPATVQLNVASMLGASGLFAEAKCCVERVLGRELDAHDRENAVALGNRVAIHSGDLDWARTWVPPSAATRFIEGHGLAGWWSDQQRAVNAILGPRTTQFGVHVAAFEDSERVVLDYYTDAVDEELDALDERVFEAVEAVYAEHPEGRGATLGVILFDVHGPETPLPRGAQ